MNELLPYIPTDRRHALARGEDLPDRAAGSTLFVDISGFTPLAESLATELGPQRGAEELTHYLNQVYDALIAELDRFRGSVIGFSGDAITCWFNEDNGLAATACALDMHKAMGQFKSISLPNGEKIPLTVKAGIAVGRTRRFLVGDPEQQLLDVLAGSLLDEMAEAEHHANSGDVVLAPSAMQALGAQAKFSRHHDAETGSFGVLSELLILVDPDPWPEVPTDSLSDEKLRPWLLPAVYQRLQAGQGEFLAELRPAVAEFVRFEGIDYDEDESAGEKLNDFVLRIQRILIPYDGTLVDITTGDKGSHLYLTFGAPVAHEDDVERAAALTLEARIEAEELDYITSLQIGINRGRMRTGAYGGRTRRTYGALGDATNLAARLMMAAEPGEVLASEAIKDKAGLSFRWKPHAAIKVKGKANPIDVATLVDRSDQGLQDSPVRAHLLPMVGRENEMAILQEKIGLALSGQGQIVGITAEAGMGKSRLMAEAVRAARGQRFKAYTGECKSYGTQSSYLVWSRIWRELLELESFPENEDQLTMIGAHVGRLNAAVLPRLPLLGPLLNFPIADNGLTRQFDAQLRKSSLELMLADLLRARAEDGALVIVLEDTHWIDPLSLDLLNELGKALVDRPVLIMLAYRITDQAAGDHYRFQQDGNFSEISLTHLGREQAAQWIEVKTTQLYGPHLQVPEEFVKRLLGRADGNPFYIEQVLNYLKDHEILLNDSRALANVELPASLHSLVLSRIDELVEQPRSTLRVASVFGRSFVGPDLGGAHPALGSEPHVEDNLAELEQKGFTELETPADPSYIFKHGVIQEVAYESLSFKLRRNLHSSIGDFLLKKHSESLEGQIDLLAHHYYRGENWSKALNFNLESARKAQREFANSAAIAAAANVLEAAEHLETETDTNAKILSAYEILGDVLSWQAQYLEAVETFETMAILAKDLGDEVAQAHAWQGMARVQMQQGDLRQAIASAEREESISVAANLKLEIVKARWVQAWGAFRLGEIERAAELANAMAELSVDLEDRSQHAENMNLQGVLQWASGDYDEAEQFFRDARSIYEETGDSLRAMPLSNNLGVIAESRGDYDSAADGYNEALSAARQIGNRDGEIVYLGNLGGVKVLQGDYVGAEADLRSVLEMSSSAGMDTLADTFSHLAEATLAQGDAEEALELSRQALDISVRVESQDDLGVVWRVLGMVAAELDEPPVIEHSPRGQNQACDAKTCFAESERIFREIGREDELARTLRSRAMYELRIGNQEQAKVKWKESRELFRKIGATYEVNRMAEFPKQDARRKNRADGNLD